MVLGIKSIPAYATKPVTLLCGYFFFIALFIGLSGNFPLNDDWAYGLAVKALLSEQQFLMPTVCAPGFAHVILGAAACSLFGYSFVVLRCLTLIIALAGTLAFYFLLKEIKIRPWEAAFLTLVYAANPLMLNLYFSFMSDISALTATVVYFLCLLRAVNRNSMRYAAAALCAMLLAISVRQSAIIFLPCNFALFTVASNHKLSRWLAWLSLLLPCLAYQGVDYWLLHRFKIGNDYEMTKAGHLAFMNIVFNYPSKAIQDILIGFGQASCYIALFIGPLLLAFATDFFKLAKKRTGYTLFVLLTAALLLLPSVCQFILVEHRLMPYNNNLLRLPTIGALGIIGLEIPPWRHGYYTTITVIAYFLAWVFISVVLACLLKLPTFFAKLSLKAKTTTFIFGLAGFTSVAFATLETIVRCSDRYYLITLVPVIVAFALIGRRLQIKFLSVLPLISLLIIGAYGILAIQDYVNWNRARWSGLNHLEEQGISYKDIDGGAEYNILRSNRAIYSRTWRGKAPRKNWRWWPIYGEKYIVSFSTIPDYEVVERIPFWSSLTFSTKEVLILKKTKL